MKKISFFLLITAIAMAGCVTAWAQATAQISGTVRDQSGAILRCRGHSHANRHRHQPEHRHQRDRQLCSCPTWRSVHIALRLPCLVSEHSHRPASFSR